MSPVLSLLVADDHPIWRETLATLLTTMAAADPVRQAATGEEAVRMAREQRPDAVIMDMQLPGMDGVAAAVAIRSDPGCPILMLCSSDERKDVLRAVRAGVSGYLVKTALPEDIVSALRRVVAGELVFDPAVAPHVMEELVNGPRDEHPLAALTDREKAVLALMADGLSNRAIGEKLFMSTKTVEAHVTAIFGKLALEEAPDSHRRVQAVVTYLRAANLRDNP